MGAIATLQARIAQLLGEEAAFRGVTVLVDSKPDFVNAVAQAMARQDLVAVVGFAEGEPYGEPSPVGPVMRERVRVSLVQHRLHTGHNLTTLLERAVACLHWQPLEDGGLGPQRLVCAGHRSEVDEEGTRVVELTVEAVVLLGDV